MPVAPPKRDAAAATAMLRRGSRTYIRLQAGLNQVADRGAQVGLQGCSVAASWPHLLTLCERRSLVPDGGARLLRVRPGLGLRLGLGPGSGLGL